MIGYIIVAIAGIMVGFIICACFSVSKNSNLIAENDYYEKQNEQLRQIACTCHCANRNNNINIKA